MLHFLTTQQVAEKHTSFDKLARHLKVRRFDIRRVLGKLDRQGYIDASRLRVTLAGFGVGISLSDRDLPALRDAMIAA